MSSLSTYEYYKDDLSKVPALRAEAETLLNNPRVREVTIAEAYELALDQWDVIETDMPIYPGFAKKVGLPEGAKCLVNNHGKIVGRTASARRFYNRLPASEQRKLEGDCRDAVSNLEERDLIKATAVVGLDKDLMLKATIIAAEDDAVNVFNWLANFTPMEIMEEEYANSKKLNIQDIIVIGDNMWEVDDDYYTKIGNTQLALVDEHSNVIYNLGMRYFGERKKGTLTLAWSSGMRLGMAACHGGIKEVDFTTCEDDAAKALGKRSLAFFGLSGTGKSSHTNSEDNGGTMPKGFVKSVLHDDAFQIDTEEKVCRVWEPSLFDKTDSRNLENGDWEYIISVMNHAVIKNGEGKIVPLGLDARNANGRAIIDRDLLGKWVNKCEFPEALAWLMKDTVLPPIIKLKDDSLALAMGAALMTKRNRAENVPESELAKLVFEPFANPFRVYELYKDVEGFGKVFSNGASCYSFNSIGFWGESDEKLTKIPLQTSLTLQTAILTDQLEWEDWDLLSGAQIPTKETVEKILPGYYDMYSSDKVGNRDEYISTLKDRFEQRKTYLQGSDLQTKPELLEKLITSLKVNA